MTSLATRTAPGGSLARNRKRKARASGATRS
jgi:hypothetical protein